jgi:heme-degrading monooxygenase HmoA
MIVMFSARRLKPGAWEQFRRAWDPGDAKPPGFQRAYHARNIRDEDEVISFGLFDMTEDDYRRWRAEADADETQRVDRVSAFVKNELVAGVYEVLDVVDDESVRTD